MYGLVTDIPAYPSFLPWCNSANVLTQHDDGITAQLGLAYMGVRQRFTTRNEQRPDELVAIKLVDGPFSVLEGTWLFRELAGQQQACKIEFELRYAFASPALEALVSPVFDGIANTLVDSFVKRAEAVYGER
jgi:ribosome-associated toxin RatA of RatAB toxin-antitoxin module